MARNSDGIFSEVFATDGDKVTPPFSIDDGFTSEYSVPVRSGGKAPERTSFNFLLNQLYALGVDINTYGGALPWDASITYLLGAVVTATDGFPYLSLITNNVGNNPINDTTNWVKIPTYNDLSATTGAALIGTTSGETVQAALNAAVIASDLADNTSAASAGAAKVGLYLANVGGNTGWAQSSNVEDFLNGGLFKAFASISEASGVYSLDTTAPWLNLPTITKDSTGKVNLTFAQAKDFSFLSFAISASGSGSAYIVEITGADLASISIGINDSDGSPVDGPFNYFCL